MSGLSWMVLFSLVSHLLFGSNMNQFGFMRRVETVEKKIQIKQPKKNESRYFYVSFDVPENASRITITYAYDTASGANAIDLGVFDSRFSGRDDDPKGFRGWSGGKRSSIFVARDDATPGYVAGEIPSGNWQVILGLYKVTPAGVEVSLKIDVETEMPSSNQEKMVQGKRNTETQSVPCLLNKQGGSLCWYRGDLHAHTVYSDGDWTIEEILTTAKREGLDFISITDHNTYSHHAALARLPASFNGPLVLRGEEVTTYGGHFNALGLPFEAWVDFRVAAKNFEGISKLAKQIHQLGALTSVNHPFALCDGCNWSYERDAKDFDAMEVWNGSWDATDEIALKWWDALLQKGRHLTALGSSDTHRQTNPPGQPTTHVGASRLNERAILTSISEGRVYVTDEPSPVNLSFTAKKESLKIIYQIGDVIKIKKHSKIELEFSADNLPRSSNVVLWSNGKELKRFAVEKEAFSKLMSFDIDSDQYFRIEIRNANGTMLAFTNPIYVDIGSNFNDQRNK